MESEKKLNNFANSTRPAYYFYQRPLVRSFFKVVDAVSSKFFKSQPVIAHLDGRILVVNLGGAGDLVASEPLLTALAEVSGKKIDLICKAGQEQVLLGLPGIGKVFYAELPWLKGKKNLANSLVNLWRLSRILRQEKYSFAFDLKGDPIIILLLLLSRISRRIGFSNGGLGFFLTHPFSQPQSLPRYQLDLVLTQAIAGDWEKYDRPPHLALSVPAEAAIVKTIVVHLGAGAPAKRWPIAYWAELLAKLAKEYKIILIGSNEDSQTLFKSAPELADSIADFSGRSWTETAAVIKQSAVFVGNDSGPGHLAAALGVKVVTIFSAANDPIVWAPPGAKVFIFKPDCYKCERDFCDKLTCLKEIKPVEVYDELIKILNS
jgi:heptosyltransferase II